MADDATATVRHRQLLEKIFIADRIEDLPEAGLEHGALLTLVGSGLGELWDNKQPTSNHITLVALESMERMRTILPVAWLRYYLQDHRYDKETCEATIKSSGIVINLWLWEKKSWANATIKRNAVQTMLQQEDGRYHTYVLYLDKHSIPDDDGLPWWSLRHHSMRPSPSWGRKAFRLPLLKPPSRWAEPRDHVECLFREWQRETMDFKALRDNGDCPLVAWCGGIQVDKASVDGKTGL